MTPLISIIIPAYNVDKYIGKCIQSCVDQTYKNLEVIVVDDGSTDRTGDLLLQLSMQDSRIQVYRQINQGVVAARNKGITESKGEYVLFVDGDDYLDKSAVELLISNLLDANADIAIGGISYDKDGKITPLKNSLSSEIDNKSVTIALLNGTMQTSLCAKLFRRSLLQDVEFVNLKVGEDAYALFQIVDKATACVLVDFPVYFYVMHSLSVMHNPNKERVKSLLEFIVLVESYCASHRNVKEQVFINSMSSYMLDQYFMFLRMGGRPDWDLSLYKRINNIYLKNTYALHNIPIWRVVVLKSFRNSPYIGSIVLFIFNNMRRLLK